MEAALIAIVATLILGTAVAASSPTPSGGSLGIKPWNCNYTGSFPNAQRVEVRAIVRDVATRIESLYRIKGLATYLDAVSFRESNWNPCIDGDQGGVSKGLFQIRATTAFSTTYTHMRGAYPQMVRDPVVATILAAYCVFKAAKSVRGRKPYWLAIRRWWKFPSLINDHANADVESPGIAKRFADALKSTKHDPDFLYETFSVSGWPGLPAVFREFGYDELADYAEKNKNA
jgi:hypothetical protein